ncbi:nephrin isoform X2 [Bacillus rossius redtenbacheri]|uniref:nephrin isoform X2 n=1 Tax=Bacillus rossius redtenbacheri TaxID=93214 RepID=UPI002FDD77F7
MCGAPCCVYLCCGVLVLLLCHASGQQQYFRIEPKDVRVHEGGEAMLECEVSNQAGRVQWTKDGFALGFSSVIAGFPRYSVLGDSRSGVYNLKISNATLEDDAEFQCQVGPARFNNPIRANARLSVISPPSSIEIVNHAPNSKIEIRENEEFQLECLVKNAKPAAKIAWYRGSVELKLERREDTTTEVAGSGRAKRYNVLSRVSLQPTAEDDYADYTCEARHEALPPDMPMRVTVQLSVLYPPGVPYVDGYTEGETMRRGQTVELVCRSRGGNPPAQLIWYKNGEQIRMAYRTAGRVSENVYTFTADASDNKAKYRCEASNVMSPAPLKTEIELTVLFAPAQVSISGPTEARVGDSVPLTCTTANSNPPAEIKWTVAGRHMRNATSRTVVSPEGGWITTSNITALVGPNRRSLVVICHGVNMQLTENVVSTHTINVLYPPSQPLIHGYTEGVSIAAGTVQKISCVSSGGNPLATLTWYKNDKKISSVTKVNDRSVSAEVTILTNVTDNEARYKCEASNSATEIPLFETVTLNVQFPPDHVVIRKEPAELRSGKPATLTCDSTSSNPEARLSWWKEGIPVPGVTNTTRPGLHGGRMSSITLPLNVAPEMNGATYTCQATNEALQRSVHDAVTLEVLFKPIFEEVPAESMIGIEGKPLALSLRANGNPSNIMYTWTKEGSVLKDEPRFQIEGPALNITRMRREDSGVYQCEAVNSEGSSVVKMNLTVQYAATIKEAPEYVMINPGEDAQLFCVVDGNPLSERHVTWRNDKLSSMEERTAQTFHNRTSYLMIQKPTREDNGVFRCTVNNEIGNETSRDVQLIVKYKPEIDTSPQISKAASNSGDMARLICRASGAPTVRFTWSKDGATIPVNTTGKFYTEFRQLDLVTYESVLLVTHVKQNDYGGYECVVRNEMGFATASVRLEVTSPPDSPTSLTVRNVTHDSVTLSWTPGFDGGMTASYRVRYRPSAALMGGYTYVDVLSPNATSYTVAGLGTATDYTFSIMAFNKLGSSKYLPDLLKAKTSSEGDRQQIISDILSKADTPRLVIIGVAVTGTLLVLLNVALVVCFIYRKRNKRLREATSEQSSSKSATIEMYAPSSYNETVTGETLSSVSEKSESYSNGDSNQEYLEDGTKPAASTYLIDQTEYSYQYPTYELQHQPKHHEEADNLNRSVYNHTIDGPKMHYSALAPPHAVDTPYYNISPDARYIPYPPPQMEYNHLPQQAPATGSLRRPQHRGTVVPPDVTVSHNPPLQNGPPAPLLSTFNPSLGYPAAIETEGHLV